MNESTLTQLKIIVERAVRPVRASTGRKRKMREELLAHVSGVFAEEVAQLSDEGAALERTALRFGNTAEATSQLQDAVPASDCIRRFWEGRPGETALRAGFRITWVTGALALVVFAAALFAGGWVSTWPREALLLCVGAVLALPGYLFGLTILTDWMEKALHGAGRSRFKVALLVVGSWLFMMLLVAGLTWPTWPADLDYQTAVLFAAWLAPSAGLFPYALAKSAVLRRRYHAEWANLPIDGENRASV
jgi:hypothetical protein